LGLAVPKQLKFIPILPQKALIKLKVPLMILPSEINILNKTGNN
jgi:hypothetical protein